MFAQHQGLFFSPPCPTGEEAGAAQEAGRGYSWPGDVICQTVWHCAQQEMQGERRRMKGECSELWSLSSQATVRCVEALLAEKQLNMCLLMRSGKWIPYCALLASAALICLSNHLNINWQVSSLLHFQSSPPACQGKAIKWLNDDLAASWGQPTAVLFGVPCETRGFWDNIPDQSVLSRISSCYWQRFILFALLYIRTWHISDWFGLLLFIIALILCSCAREHFVISSGFMSEVAQSPGIPALLGRLEHHWNGVISSCPKGVVA